MGPKPNRTFPAGSPSPVRGRVLHTSSSGLVERLGVTAFSLHAAWQSMSLAVSLQQRQLCVWLDTLTLITFHGADSSFETVKVLHPRSEVHFTAHPNARLCFCWGYDKLLWKVNWFMNEGTSYSDTQKKTVEIFWVLLLFAEDAGSCTWPLVIALLSG